MLDILYLQNFVLFCFETRLFSFESNHHVNELAVTNEGGGLLFFLLLVLLELLKLQSLEFLQSLKGLEP